MDLNNLFRMANNFYYTYPYVVYGIIAALAILTLWKPKKVLKGAFFLLLGIAAAYILYLVGHAVWAGFTGKGHMLNKY